MTDLRVEHEQWLSRAMEQQQTKGWSSANPLVRAFGPDPEGRRCKECRFLYARQYSKRYYKCELRGVATKGAATDHRVNWPACTKFQAQLGGVTLESKSLPTQISGRRKSQGRGQQPVVRARRAEEANS